MPVLERHGATVERSFGRCGHGYLRDPRGSRGRRLRAVRAAAEMRERLIVLGDELSATGMRGSTLRVGIGTGEVVAGGRRRAALMPPVMPCRRRYACDKMPIATRF